MATGTLGTTARDYPSRGERFCVNLNATNMSNLSFKIGTIPTGSVIARCTTINGTTAFGSTTNTVALGTAANGAQIMAAAAIGGAGVITPETLVTGASSVLGPLAADTPIWLTTAFTGAAPAAGAASVLVLEWFNPGAL